MLVDLKGENALVTSEGREIGKACDLKLAKSGANLIINDLKKNNDFETTKNFSFDFTCFSKNNSLKNPL